MLYTVPMSEDIPVTEITVQPFAEPVCLSEVKLRIKQDELTDDDPVISSLIVAARDVVETGTGANADRHKVMVVTSFSWTTNRFPHHGPLRLPKVPLLAVTSITYVDQSGVTQTWAASNYVFSSNGLVWHVFGQFWPFALHQALSVTVNFTAGVAAPISVNISTGVVTVKGRVVTNGDRLRAMVCGGVLPGGVAIGELPAGLSALTDYFVIGAAVTASGCTCQLSLTTGGSAVAFTDVGKEQTFLTSDAAGFETLRNAVKMLVAHLNLNREAVLTGTRAAAIEVPWGIQALINSQHV